MLNDTATVTEALLLHYAAAGLLGDGGRSACYWTLKLGPVRVRMKNFAWRRGAMQQHDIHHLLTGYTCTPAGELEIAAWEFAAGRFANRLATLFCLPLVACGAVTIPHRSFRAFVRGRYSRTLYVTTLSADPLMLSLAELRRRLLPAMRPTPTLHDSLEYLALAGLSFALAGVPIAILVALYLSRG